MIFACGPRSGVATARSGGPDTDVGVRSSGRAGRDRVRRPPPSDRSEPAHRTGPGRRHGQADAALGVDDALAIVLADLAPLPPERRPILEALGQVAGADVRWPCVHATGAASCRRSRGPTG